MAGVRAHPDDAQFHLWRRRVKDHWYHMRLLEAVQSSRRRPYVTTLHRLESLLGDHHNLVVVRTHLQAARLPRSMRDDVDRLCEIITRTEERLRDKAVALGDRIYAEDGRTFVRRLKRLWHAWKNA